MANRETMIKSIAAAMNSVSKIQQEQNKLRMNLLLNSQKYQNNFLNEMKLADEKFKREKEMKAWENANPSPVDQARINYYKGGGNTRPPSIEERIKTKIAEGGEESLLPGEKIIWGNMKKTDKITDSDEFRAFYGDISSAIETGTMTPEDGWKKIQRQYPDKIKDLMMGGIGVNSLRQIAPKKQPKNDGGQGLFGLFGNKNQRMKVKLKETGQTGTIEPQEYDESIYERI